jgi:hypothetical protein
MPQRDVAPAIALVSQLVDSMIGIGDGTRALLDRSV